MGAGLKERTKSSKPQDRFIALTLVGFQPITGGRWTDTKAQEREKQRKVVMANLGKNPSL